MAYRYRVTLLKATYARIEDLETGRRFDAALGSSRLIVRAMIFPPLRPARSEASLRTSPPGHPTILCDHRRLPSGSGYDCFDLGPIEPGDSFLLWTEEGLAIPDP